MAWAVIVVRTLVGVGFVLSAVTWVLGTHAVHPTVESPGTAFIWALSTSGYLYVVKALEFTGGLMIASGRMAPLGVTLTMPVAVNILLFELVLKHEPGPGLVLVAMLAFVIYGYWPYFARVFTTAARVGG